MKKIEALSPIEIDEVKIALGEVGCDRLSVFGHPGNAGQSAGPREKHIVASSMTRSADEDQWLRSYARYDEVAQLGPPIERHAWVLGETGGRQSIRTPEWEDADPHSYRGTGAKMS